MKSKASSNIVDQFTIIRHGLRCSHHLNQDRKKKKKKIQSSQTTFKYYRFKKYIPIIAEEVSAQFYS